MTPFRLASILFGTVFPLWVVFATVMMPQLYQSVYNGGLPFLRCCLVRNRVVNGVVNPLEAYLDDWSFMSQRWTVSLLLFGLLALVIVKALETRTFFDKFVGNARSGQLGAIRMLTCGILLVSTSLEQLSSAALLPGDIRRPMGLMRLLDILPVGFDRFLASEPSLWTFQILTLVLLFLGMIGCWTRLVVPLAVLCAYVFNGILREFSFFWHQNLVPIYVLAVLSFTPCGDGWSVDRLRSIYKGRPVPDGERAAPVYGWSLYACWVPIALLYCWSGLSKLRQSGLMWVGPTNMRTVLYEESLTGRWYPLGQALHIAWAPDFVFVLLGVVAISGELAYPAVLFSRRARLILPLVTMGMHVGIILLQDIVFLDLIALNLILLDFSSLRDAVARRLSRRGALQILYDGSCKYCRGTVRVLTAMDLFSRLTVTDFRRLDLEEFNRANSSALDAEALEQEMALVWRGRVFSGFRAYRVLSTVLPALWIVAPLMYLPGIAPLGTWAYRYVAVRRHGHARCDERCETEAVAARAFFVPELTTAQRFGYVLGLSALATVMMVAFFFKIEFYPFTAMQLFTGLRSSDVTYFRVIGERESGERLRVRIEDAIPLTSFNGRYMVHLEACFGDAVAEQICRKFLAASLAAYNRKSQPHERLIGYEVEKVIWDYHVSPDDPMYGRVVERYALTAVGSPPAATRQTASEQ